jgi:hypothetical protein
MVVSLIGSVKRNGDNPKPLTSTVSKVMIIRMEFDRAHAAAAEEVIHGDLPFSSRLPSYAVG